MLYFITGNKHKFEEVQRAIPDIQQAEIDVHEIQSLNPHEIISFKLYEARKHFKGMFVVEDSSFNYDALNGLPGPLIKWFFNSLGDKGMWEIAKNSQSQKATMSSIFGLSMEDGEVKFFEGSIRGTVVEPRNLEGKTFGIDPIFMPDGFDRTFSQMSIEEKNVISHRGIALAKLKTFLADMVK